LIGSDLVRGMIKLYLNGYLSYDEISGWAANKCRNTEFIADAGDADSEALFDILSQMMEGRDDGRPLETEDFEGFLERLDHESKLGVYD